MLSHAFDSTHNKRASFCRTAQHSVAAPEACGQRLSARRLCVTVQRMSRTEPITLQQLVANLSPLEIRVDTIEALRQWRRKHRGLREFNVQTNLATEFILVVGKRKNVQLPAGSTFTNLCGEFMSSNSEALVRDAI